MPVSERTVEENEILCEKQWIEGRLGISIITILITNYIIFLIIK